ncbi:hypothetical protein [Chitinophaga solisilvae]|uniref:hypothetical protein n=1 Tax=Chitinophaga solisilvae TaxID=1233460 RepID=UPI00136E7786|nr:hypothetical protein [Chitinophaga solisilvae]
MKYHVISILSMLIPSLLKSQEVSHTAGTISNERITGKVNKEQAGLSISIKGTATGTVTSAQERFRLVIPILSSLTPVLTTFIAGRQNTIVLPQIDKFYFYLSFFFSLFYLLILLIIVLYTPFADAAITLFGNSVTYLAIFQGLVTSTLGLFFAKGS